MFQDCRCDVEVVLKANYIEVNNEQSTTALVLEDIQKEFEEFWDSHKHDPIAGTQLLSLEIWETQSSSTNKQYGIFNTMSPWHLKDFSLSYCYPNSIMVLVEEVQLMRTMKECCNLLPVVCAEAQHHY